MIRALILIAAVGLTVRRMMIWCSKCGWISTYTGKPDVEGRVCPRCGNPWLIIEGDEL